MDSTSTSRKAWRERNRGPYKGIRMRAWGKWVSEIRVLKSGERIWLGSYDAPEKAARAYDAALYCIRGACAQFNFPADERPQLPKGSRFFLSRKEIQSVATKFASSTEPIPSFLEATTHAPMDIPELLDFPGSSERLISYVGDMIDPGTCVASPDSFDLDDLFMLDLDWINDWP